MADATADGVPATGCDGLAAGEAAAGALEDAAVVGAGAGAFDGAADWLTDGELVGVFAIARAC